MGFLDKIKAMFGGAAGPDVGRIVNASVGTVTTKSKEKIVGMAEDAAKEVISDLASDAVNAELDKLDDVPSGYLRDKLVEKAIEQVVEKVWEKVKEEAKAAQA